MELPSLLFGVRFVPIHYGGSPSEEQQHRSDEGGEGDVQQPVTLADPLVRFSLGFWFWFRFGIETVGICWMVVFGVSVKVHGDGAVDDRAIGEQVLVGIGSSHLGRVELDSEGHLAILVGLVPVSIESALRREVPRVPIISSIVEAVPISIVHDSVGDVRPVVDVVEENGVVHNQFRAPWLVFVRFHDHGEGTRVMCGGRSDEQACERQQQQREPSD